METRSAYAILQETPAYSEKDDEYQLNYSPIPLISEIVLAQFILPASKLYSVSGQ